MSDTAEMEHTMNDDTNRRLDGTLVTASHGREIIHNGHLCEGANLTPSLDDNFCLWHRCGDADVPADSAHEGDIRQVTCKNCLEIWNIENGQFGVGGMMGRAIAELEKRMPETKSFPTLIVGSTLTGVGLCAATYSDIHECASWLYGEDIWTHELVHPEIQAAYKAEGYRQFSKIPLREDEVAANWKAVAAQMVTDYGENVEVVRGSAERRKGPMETLSDLLSEKQIVALIALAEQEPS